MHALLGLTEDSLTEAPLPDSLQVLGFRRDAGLLGQLCDAGAPLLLRANTLPPDPAEELARDLWALGAGQPAHQRYTLPPAVV